MTQDLVLTFHGIGSPPPGIPEAERPYWMPAADFLAFLEGAVAKAQQLGLRLTATFDDGNRSDLEIAAPALRRHGIAGLFFPCSGRLGKPGYLAAADLRHLVGMGFGVGSHGVDHLPWASLSPAQLAAELALSKTAIEAAIGQPVTAAAMPFGSYDRRVLGGLRRAGYRTVYSSDPGFGRSGAFFQRRWSYRQGMDFDLERLAKLSRAPARRAAGAVKHLVKSLR